MRINVRGTEQVRKVDRGNNSEYREGRESGGTIRKQLSEEAEQKEFRKVREFRSFKHMR